MRMLVIAALAACAPRTAPVVPAPVAGTDLDRALAGEWVGVLEYRDYSEPPESPKRVRLPTWLTIAVEGDHLRWDYTYDDGPNKTVEDVDLVTIAGDRYTEQEPGQPARVSAVTGLAALRAGRGTFVVTGEGPENDVVSEIRLSFTVGRNSLEIVKDTRPKSADTPLEFRHAYRFTRARRPTPRTVAG